MSSAINLLTNSPEISGLSKRDVFELNLSQDDESIRQQRCGKDFSNVWEPLTLSLPKGVLKQDLFHN